MIISRGSLPPLKGINASQNSDSNGGNIISRGTFPSLSTLKPYKKPTVAATKQQPKSQPNLLQQAEQGVSNFFGGFFKQPNTIKASPNSLPTGLKLDYVTPSQKSPTNLNIEGKQPKGIKLNKKISIEPPPKITKYDSSKLIDPFNTGVTAVDLAPSTIKTLADLQVDPFSLNKAPKATLKDLFSPFGNPISNSITNNYIKGIVDSVKADAESIKALFNAKSKSERAGAAAQTVARTVGVAFSPLTSLFSAANDIPVLGTVSRLISLPFDVLGDAGRDIAYPVANMLPISKKAKENIVDGIGEIASLALMIGVGGKIADIPGKVKEGLVKKYGIEDAQTIMQKAQEQAAEKARLQKIAQEKDAQYQQFASSKESSKTLQLPAGKTEATPLLEARNPQSHITGEGFTMSDTVNKRNLQLLKAQNEYLGALRDYNRRPTPAKLAKVQQLREKFTTLRDSTSTTPKTLKEVVKPGEYTPKDLRKAVLSSPLKNTPEAQQIVRESINAEQQGKNVNVSHVEDTKQVDVTTAGKGNSVSSVGKTIEAKAIEDELIKNAGDTAKYESSTFAEQAQKAADLINSGIENARAVIRGEKPLPEGLRTSSLLAAMQKYVKQNPENAAEILQEMSNSPLIGENISKGAQEVSFSRMIEQDSATAKLQDLKKARIDKVGGLEKVDKAKSSLKSAINKVNLSKEELSWNSFLDSIKC